MAKHISEPNMGSVVSQEAIGRRAYEIWESEGRPDGRAMEHWLRAVSELKAQSDGAERGSMAPKQPRPARRSTPRLVESRFQTTR